MHLWAMYPYARKYEDLSKKYFPIKIHSIAGICFIVLLQGRLLQSLHPQLS